MKIGRKLSNDNVYSLVIKGLLTDFGGMLFESKNDCQSRKVKNTKIKGWIIHTTYVSDTRKYETGIQNKDLNDGNWVSVEEYETKKEAEEGHKSWIKAVLKQKEFFDIFYNEIFKLSKGVK